MSKYAYKITDIVALAAAYPKAVETIMTANRVELGKIWKASQVLGATIPGVEAIEADKVLESIPAHIAKETNA